MTLNRYNAKRDQVEGSIVQALRKAGCRVSRSNQFDLIVQCGIPPYATTHLLEVKAGKHWSLTKLQQERERQGWQVIIVHTEEDALQAVGLLP